MAIKNTHFYTFLHIFILKCYITYYKSARYKIITHFYTLVYIRVFIIVFEQLRHYFLRQISNILPINNN